MKSPFASRFFGHQPETDEALSSTITDSAISHWNIQTVEESTTKPGFLRTVGWVSAGVGAIALGLVVGREIRQRYKFTRRTPYDFYAHAGDERDMEFGVGI